MKKIVILGCENSHADIFLGFITSEKRYQDVKVVGVYSDDISAAQKLNEKYGVKVMNAYDEEVGKVDGVMVTARHGDSHYKFVKPYVQKGVTFFIDKPITISQTEAVELARLLRDNECKVVGGSCCKYDDVVQNLRKDFLENEDGETVGGIVRAPVNLENAYGNFFFYSQHLIDIMTGVYGFDVKSVAAFRNGSKVNVVFRYENFDITGIYYQGKTSCYYVGRCSENCVKGGTFIGGLGGVCYGREFEEYYKLLQGGEQPVSYNDFIKAVFVLNAIARSLENGKEESVETYEI